MKKICFILSCSTFFLNNVPVCGQHAASTSGRFVTYRVGVSVAGEYASIDGHLKNRPLNSFDLANIANDNFASDAHHTCHKFQISPGFELGALIAQQYYLGFVLSKHYTHASNTMNTSIGDAIHFEHQLKLTSYTNLFLKFGYKIIPNVMFYGLVGPSIANWSHNSKTFFYDPARNYKEVLVASKMNKKTTGFGIGGGIEYVINNKYAINMEYTLSMHKAEYARYRSSYNNHNVYYDPTYGLYHPFVNPETISADVQKNVRLSYSTIGLRFSYFFSF
ncbi:MAG: outer membrane beta-barrel protein [Pseudomonadota bacterium]